MAGSRTARETELASYLTRPATNIITQHGAGGCLSDLSCHSFSDGPAQHYQKRTRYSAIIKTKIRKYTD